VGLVGPNGCGKSTLLRILAGVAEADFGTVTRPATFRLLEQEPKLPGATVGEAADEAIAWHHELLAEYEATLADGDFEAAEALQARLDVVGWTVEHRVDALLDRLGAPPREAETARLSGGERRRVALARALLGQPKLLMLDEPTNHLDADTIDWLQGVLGRWEGAVLFVTHDRYLLEAVATRIVEVDDGVCVSYNGSYGDYLVERAERQAAMQRAEDTRLAYIAREAAWAARSPAARSTKQKARLQRLDTLQAKRALRTDETFDLDLRTGSKTGSTVMEGRDLRRVLGGRLLIDGLTISLARGERLGIVGPNGCGKSTLLRLISRQDSPDGGDLVFGGGVQIAMLDQHRSGLVDGDSVFEAAAGGNNYVTLGDRSVHVAGFLKRFLFARETLTQRVEALSGGERARLLLAKLLLQGANLILLDEPTNDLDLLTLRVLEEALLSFDGTAVVITHDRAFLDRVCTRVLAFEGDGVVTSYADRTQAHRAAVARRQAIEEAARGERESRRAVQAESESSRKATKVRKLSSRERSEYMALPQRIEVLEAESAELSERLNDPAVWQGQEPEGAELQRRIDAIPPVLEGLYARWEELEKRA